MRTLMILGVLAVWVLTPSESQGMADGEGGEAIEFGNLMISAAPTESLTQRLPCCRLWSKKPCQFCAGSFSAVRLPIDIPATPTEMTMESMDSEVLDVNVRRLAKRQLPSSQDNPPPRCCRKKKKNCRVCPSGNIPLGRNFEDTTTEQMKSMDSEVPDVNVRRLAKRQLQSLPNPPPRCCKRGKCWRCTGGNSPIANYFNDTTSDQMESMDSEVLDVNVRRLAKRQLPSSQDNPPPRCCRWKKICRGCTGGNTPLGRNFEDTTTEEMESMDSEVLDVNVRRLAKRQLQSSQDNPPRCCRWKKTCWACTGGNTPLGRNFEDTTTEETANSGNEDLTEKRFRRSAAPCCQGNSERPPGCRHCPGAYSRSFKEKSSA